MLCKRGLCRHVVSVRLSVTFVDSVEMNKRIFKIFPLSSSHTILVFYTKRRGNIPTWTPNRGVECRWGRRKSRFSTNIWLSDRWLLQCEQCDRPLCSLPHRRRRISQSCSSQAASTITTKRREQNRIYLYAASNLTYYTIDATDRHEASRGLSAMAGLFVRVYLAQVRHCLAACVCNFINPRLIVTYQNCGITVTDVLWNFRMDNSIGIMLLNSPGGSTL